MDEMARCHADEGSRVQLSRGSAAERNGDEDGNFQVLSTLCDPLFLTLYVACLHMPYLKLATCLTFFAISACSRYGGNEVYGNRPRHTSFLSMEMRDGEQSM